ncbi:MAG: Coenzyme F420-dependent N10-methylene tetrahydromethanopterin reductase-like protein [Frankiales bacterium]|nr:Coenzyme F420-dependent N10-methylene tetrahydromethanopterin reductase-like protein [Frankiales bacterium]
MDLRIFTEPQQGATYDQLLAVAQKTEECGFDAFFRSDHYLNIGGEPGVGSTDAWLTLAALARETSTIRLGTLVTPVTFRLPGPLAISVAQVDQMSGGRVELGLGTGWYDGEHAAYGIPFPAIGERFDLLEEQLAIVRGLWTSTGPFSYAGKHYQLTDSPALPKPVQAHVPIVMGGFGKKRTPRLAAAYADEYNVPFHPVADTAGNFSTVKAAADETGRTLVYSTAQSVAIGKDDAEVARRSAAIGQTAGLQGTPAQVVDLLGQFAEAGATRAYLQVLDLTDLDHLELIASEVLPQL